MSPELNSQDTAQKARLLGLAFAGADVVFELSLAGQVTFALGAVRLRVADYIEEIRHAGSTRHLQPDLMGSNRLGISQRGWNF